MAKTKSESAPETDPLVDDLNALVVEWTTHAKSQGLMTDELKAVLAKYAPPAKEEDPK